MLKEQRKIYYDSDLDVEAYNLSGIVQKFPNHFHEFYVIGFIEGGRRHLSCKSGEYELSSGDLLLFNPGDNHFCMPVDSEPLDYRAVNISVGAMRRAVQEITGSDYAPRFSCNVVKQSELTALLSDVYDAIVTAVAALQKEEIFFFLLEQILQEYTIDSLNAVQPQFNRQIKLLCDYMEDNFADNITLDDLLAMTDFSKSYLLRSFTKEVGVSPYRYLQSVRLNKAKKFLEEGMTPTCVAMAAGFSDQSHFTNYFKEFIGLTPKQYQKIFTDINDIKEKG